MKNRVALLILTLDVGPLGHKHLYYFRVFFLRCVKQGSLAGDAVSVGVSAPYQQFLNHIDILRGIFNCIEQSRLFTLVFVVNKCALLQQFYYNLNVPLFARHHQSSPTFL
jgi:hypothetical protein